MGRRAEGARPSFKTILILVAMPLGGMAIFFFWQWLHGGATPPELTRDVPAVLRGERPKPPTEAPEAEPVAESPKKKVREERPVRRVASNEPLTGSIVLIIDDLGFEGQPLDRLMRLDPDITMSVLPNASNAAAVAERLASSGFEVLCHLPMEPRGTESPGRGAILTSMDDEEIARLTRENLAAVPHAVGANNHMGSRATADRRVMASVLGALPAGIFFIDSRTGGKSVALELAREAGVPHAGRHVFLDDLATDAAVARQLDELVSVAEEKGLAIGIGHPYAATLRVLERELPRLRERGLEVVRASAAVEKGRT